MPPTKRKRTETPNDEAESDCSTTVEKKKKVRWEGKSRVTNDSERSDSEEEFKTNDKACRCTLLR